MKCIINTITFEEGIVLISNMKKLAMVMLILVFIFGMAACDNGGLGDDEDVVEDYTVNVVVEDVSEDDLDRVRILAGNNTYDELNEYYQDGEIVMELTLTETVNLSVLHKGDETAFTPQEKAIGFSDDGDSLIFRKGIIAENIEELEVLLIDENVRAIILGGNIDFEAVDDELFELDLDRNLIVDGYGDYGIKGDGSMIIFLNEDDLVFKNISFILGKQTDYWDDPEHSSNRYIEFFSDGGNLKFYNIQVSQNHEDINHFLVSDRLGEVHIKESEIDLKLNGHFVDINTGGNLVLKNNNLSGSSDWGFIRSTNQKAEGILIIEDNNFNEITGNLIDVSTAWGDYNASVNDIILEPVNDFEDSEEVKDFKDKTLEIHNNLGLTNEMPENYYTMYGYGDAEEDIFEYVSYEGYIDTETEVEFADAQLEKAVRDRIDQQEGPIYKGLVDSIEHFHTGIGGIESLEGMEYFVSLEELNIYSEENNAPNKIDSLKPLENLDKLNYLRVIDNEKELNLESLNELLQLETLYLQNNVLNDISPISNLDNLVNLGLGNTGINDSDLEYIIDLNNLKRLYIFDNNLNDISILNNLIQLQELSLYRNPNIKNLSVLKELSNLTLLNLGATNLQNEDLNVIKDLENLELLAIHDNPISDISSLKNLESLISLYIYWCEIENIEVVQNFKNLELLSMMDNEISNIEPVSGLTNLEILSFTDNKISSIEPVKDLINLEFLNFANNNVSDINPLIENEGWSEGNIIRMNNNNFDPYEEENMKIIEELKSLGVEVEYDE